ncbi:MAG: glycerophosphodiester phosphodiesterase [Pseudomonadales bacterium]|jgi:glycerophosphoryl diester phosphodiesterase|nr:glycerophosphodiester phosphodiesterase [Pseudomonadales bacterium]MCP5320863.1 glycerophosphodiester phosphodiesterase [Pseudomonadales bacterium]MCP5337663.1 glycerophosphodiester phosphodiesterase [Pseudomonadales bacterium]
MLIYGHRGARGEAPENTLAGFRRAIDVGVTRVELDLRLSRDGELVVIHDESLSRTTGARGLVEHLSVAELMRLDARHGGPDWPDPQPVPTIARVLEEFPELEHLQLEIKPVAAPERTRMVDRLVALFRDFDLQQRATVTSFDRELLLALRDNAPQVPIGLVSDRSRPEPLGLAQALGAGLLVLHWKLCVEKRLRAAHALGMQVSAWTVNDEARVRQLYQLGVDSVVTDYPARIAAFVRALTEASVQRSS